MVGIWYRTGCRGGKEVSQSLTRSSWKKRPSNPELARLNLAIYIDLPLLARHDPCIYFNRSTLVSMIGRLIRINSYLNNTIFKAFTPQLILESEHGSGHS